MVVRCPISKIVPVVVLRVDKLRDLVVLKPVALDGVALNWGVSERILR